MPEFIAWVGLRTVLTCSFPKFIWILKSKMSGFRDCRFRSWYLKEGSSVFLVISLSRGLWGGTHSLALFFCYGSKRFGAKRHLSVRPVAAAWEPLGFWSWSGLALVTHVRSLAICQPLNAISRFFMCCQIIQTLEPPGALWISARSNYRGLSFLTWEVGSKVGTPSV